jgi:hypothetical protein
MSESELEQQIREELCGVRLHRKRIVTPFAHVTDSPLVDVLFSITRGALPAPKRPISPPPDAPPDEPLVPKGMVNYRRERWAAPGGEYGDR